MLCDGENQSFFDTKDFQIKISQDSCAFLAENFIDFSFKFFNKVKPKVFILIKLLKELDLIEF